MEEEAEDVVVLYDINETNFFKYLGFEEKNRFYDFHTVLYWLIKAHKKPDLTTEELDNCDCELISEEEFC